MIIQAAYHHFEKVFIFHKYYAGTDSNLMLVVWISGGTSSRRQDDKFEIV